MASKPLLKQQVGRGDVAVIILTAGYSFSNFEELIFYDDEDPSIASIRGAELHVVILNQLIEVPTLDVFEVETDVARFVSHLLAREALANVMPDSAANNSRPGVALLYARDNFATALVTHGVVRTEEDLILIQLRHDDHEGPFMQQPDGGYFAQRTPLEIRNSRSFFCLK